MTITCSVNEAVRQVSIKKVCWPVGLHAVCPISFLRGWQAGQGQINIEWSFPLHQHFWSVKISLQSQQHKKKKGNKKIMSRLYVAIKFPFLSCFALGQRVGDENYPVKLSVSIAASVVCAKTFRF